MLGGQPLPVPVPDPAAQRSSRQAQDPHLLDGDDSGLGRGQRPEPGGRLDLVCTSRDYGRRVESDGRGPDLWTTRDAARACGQRERVNPWRQTRPQLTRCCQESSTVDREVDPQALGGPVPLPGGAQPAESLDQQRVVDEGGRRVDQVVQHLVVPGGRHLELVPDRLLLGSGELPPLALERQDLGVTDLGSPTPEVAA